MITVFEFMFQLITAAMSTIYLFVFFFALIVLGIFAIAMTIEHKNSRNRTLAQETETKNPETELCEDSQRM